LGDGVPKVWNNDFLAKIKESRRKHVNMLNENKLELYIQRKHPTTFKTKELFLDKN
jgi:hypothetical protein